VITDTHAHVYWDSYAADLEEVLARARAAGVARTVLVGTDVETSRRARDLARRHAGLYWTAGVHPHDARTADAAVRQAVEALAREPDCRAVGETGLDFFKNFSPREAQLENFAWHIELARRIQKPLVVHSRAAHAETAAALRACGAPPGVMHCYSMGPDELPQYLELGLHVSFSGVLTYPRNDGVREAARLVPDERLLVETDAPFLAPQSRRGQRNEPAFVVEVVETLARLRGTSAAELARVTSANAAALFDLADRTGGA
jgi:TatD DNase family protein